MVNKILIATLIAATTFAGELINPSASYELDTWGSNSEVYEFTPKTNPNYTCVVFILDNLKSTSMECFPKTK